MTHSTAGQLVTKLVVGSTFTAEPLEEALTFWADQTGTPCEFEFVPDGEVIDELMASPSMFTDNQLGMNVVLLRLEDWLKRASGSAAEAERQARVDEQVHDFVTALGSASERSKMPFLVVVCPSSPLAAADDARAALLTKEEELLRRELEAMGRICLVTGAELNAAYPVAEFYDAYSERAANQPYTPAFLAALATAVFRKLHALLTTRCRVVVLHARHVLSSERDSAAQRRTQQFLVALHAAGTKICLYGGHDELSILAPPGNDRQRPLGHAHVAAWRSGGNQPSESMRSLAGELHIGLDSFVFVGADPAECADVRENCPEAVMLCLPSETGGISRFLEHIWCLDVLKVGGIPEGLGEHLIPAGSRSALYNRIATDLNSAERIQALIESRADRERPDLAAEYEAPQTEMERTLASIWQAVIHVRKIGINDDFFQLGGNSLQATQVISRIRSALQVDMTLAAYFEKPTIVALREKIEELRNSGAESTVTRIIRLPREAYRPEVSA